jgi:hypothetical protein
MGSPGAIDAMAMRRSRTTSATYLPVLDEGLARLSVSDCWTSPPSSCTTPAVSQLEKQAKGKGRGDEATPTAR